MQALGIWPRRLAAAWLVIIALVGGGLLAGGEPSAAVDEALPVPVYDEAGRLVRPDGYDRWIFAGTSLGLNYIEGEVGPGPQQFHSVYIPQAAFDYYVRHGEFPEKTVLVMTNSPASRREGSPLINRHGHYAGRSQGLEVAVKDSSQFYDGWGYFIFPTAKGKSMPAKAFARENCYDCHAEHAEADNVFVQFYSVLEEAREAHLAGVR